MANSKASSSPAIVGKAIPSLLSQDLAATTAFYQKLGFAITGEWGDGSPDWIEVSRDAMVLQFYRDPPIGTHPGSVLSGTLYFEVNGLDALVKEFAADTTFEWGPELMDYGQREFAIRDPDGYLLAFFQKA